MGKITEARFDEKNQSDHLNIIDFCLNKAEYYALYLHPGKEWEIEGIYHRYEKNAAGDGAICPYCNRLLLYGNRCTPLTEKMNELGEMLLKHPNIRIKALYKGIKK